MSVVEHQLVGHLDVAGSFLDRVQVSASLPVMLMEQRHAGVRRGAHQRRCRR